MSILLGGIGSITKEFPSLPEPRATFKRIAGTLPGRQNDRAPLRPNSRVDVTQIATGISVVVTPDLIC